MNVYTFSQLQQFLNCARKYKYNYVDLVSPVYDGVPRPVGTAVHLAIDAMMRGTSALDALEQALARYWRDIPEDVYDGLDVKEQDKVKKGVEQITCIVQKYPWAQTNGTKLLASELIVEIPMGHDRAYKGRVDQVLEHNGGVWVHDTKTTGFGIEMMAKTLRLRKQFVGYFMLARHWLDRDQPTPPLKGVMSDIIAKPRVYLRKDGGVTVSGEGFHREPMHVSEQDVEGFVGWFHHIATLIEHNETTAPCDHPWPQNTDTCVSFMRTCPYFEACRNPKRAAQLFEDAGQFTKRDVLHPEYPVDTTGEEDE
jgi:hypothetical protein